VGLGLFWIIRRPRFLLGYIYVAALVVILLLAYSPEDLTAFSRTYVFKDQESILATRLDHWKGSLSYIREAWLFGYGLGTSPGVADQWEFSFSSWHLLRVRGSSLFAAWEETGLVGLLLIFATPVAVLMGGLRYFRSRQPQRAEAATRIATLLGLLLVGFVNMVTEEWLLAPGYFGNVFFWMIVFLLSRELTAGPPHLQVKSCPPMAQPGRP
jgi:O-antigen ligase